MKLSIAIAVLLMVALPIDAGPHPWMKVSGANELAFVVNAGSECEYPKGRLEEILVRNIYQLELVPILYPIAHAGLFLRVNLSCFRYATGNAFAFDLDIDFGVDNGEVRMLYIDGEYDAYGVMAREGIDAMVESNTERAVTDFAFANNQVE